MSESLTEGNAMVVQRRAPEVGQNHLENRIGHASGNVEESTRVNSRI